MLLAVLMVAGMLPAQVLAEELTPVIQENDSVPTEGPTEQPTEKPTESASNEPTGGGNGTPAGTENEATEAAPTEKPTEAPATEAPTEAPPTEAPATEAPTEAPTEEPEEESTEAPTEVVIDQLSDEANNGIVEAENYLILSEDYTSLGTWTIVSATDKDDWHNLHLKGKTDSKPASSESAVATINVKTAGTYYLWVNTKPYSTNPAQRHFEIDVNGVETEKGYGTETGASTKEPYEWYGPVEVTLNEGTNTVKAVDTSGYYAHLNGILLTSQPEESFTPNGMSYAEIEAMSVRNTPGPEVTGTNYLILADSYDTLGNWTVKTGETGVFSVGRLAGSTDRPNTHEETPAVATIDNVTAGTYYLWVNDKQFAANDYKTRFFNLELNGTKLIHTFGQVKPAATGYYWEGPIEVTLNDGTNTIKALDTSGWYANLNGILLTNKKSLNPAELPYAYLSIISTKKTVVPTEPEVDKMEDVTISTDHPGGGVKVKEKKEGVVTFEPDMTGHDNSSGHWFYWNFKATSTTDRTVTFKTDDNYYGDSGPLYSTDGENWDYLCPKSSSGTFTYDLKANEPVYFSCTLPYQYADLLDWLKTLESKSLVSVNYKFAKTARETFTAAQIAAGEANPHINGGVYDIPMITLGSTSAPKFLYFSGRMHCCETVASYTLEGTVNYFAQLSADDPFWDEYCIYVVPMIDVEGVENGDQGKSRNLTDLDPNSAVDHDHNRDWEDGKEVFNYTKAAKSFVKDRIAAGQKLELYIDFHCPYLNGYDGNYISYGKWNEEEIMIFSDILEEVVAADTRADKLSYSYAKGQNNWSLQAAQEPAVSKTWFYNQGAVATFSFETLFTEKNPTYYASNVRALGENIAKTTIQFLNEVGKSGENEITSFKIGETAGTIESGKTVGQVDMYHEGSDSVKEWTDMGSITLEAGVPVVLEFTAIGQSEGATGKYRLATDKVRLTDSEGNVTEIAAKDCFKANGNADQNQARSTDGLWLTQNHSSKKGTTTGCSVLITLEAAKTDTYKFEMYLWSNQDGGIYELTDPRNFITVEVDENTDTTSLTPTVTVSDKATYAPTGAQDFSKGPVAYTVTAENGKTNAYVVTVTGGNGGTVTPDPEPSEPDPEPEYEQYLILPDSFDSLGTWTVMDASGLTDWGDLRLLGAMVENPPAAKPAVATIDVETAGTYYLWVNCKHFLASQSPEKRFFNISVNDAQVNKTYGQVQVTGSAAAYEWEGPIAVTLNAGTNTVKALDTSLYWANIGGILLTNNENLNPATLSYKEVLDISVKKTVTPSEPGVDKMEDVTIDTAFPGGGVIVVSKEENVITLDQDLSQCIPEEYHWFYWNFKVTSQSDRLVKFNFKWASSIGDGGVLYSTDGDKTWNYLGRTNNSHQYFTYQLKAGETVHFACALPYQYADLQAWLQELEALNSSLISVDYDFAKTGFETFTQEQINAGLANPNNDGKVYNIPMITLGNPDAPKYLFFTARMHACETVASFVLEGVVNDFAKLPADDPFWDEYCIYVVPMMDVEGVENGDQGKNRAPHDHNRDWAEGEELYNVTKAVKAFVNDLTAADKKLDVFIDFHCPYLFNWAGNYLAYGDWNVNEIKAFAAILEKTVAADTSANKIGYDFDDVNSYSQNITNDPTKPDAKNWFYKQGAIMTCSLETLFTETNLLYQEDNLHQWGGNIAESLREFLTEANKSGENEITSFKIGETAGTIESGKTVGQVDMYHEGSDSVKEWRDLGTIDLEANVPVVLDFTAIGQSEGATGKFRLAAEKVRLTDSAGNVTEIAAKDCFTANGNATENGARASDGLWLTQNFKNSVGTGDPTGCSVLITLEVSKTDTYKIEMYTWSNQDGGIYELTDTRNFITVEVDENADTTSLTPTVTVSNKATYAPTGAQDFSKGIVTYTVTAENGDTKAYAVNVIGGNGGTDAPGIGGDDDEDPVEPGQTTPAIHSIDGMYEKVYTDTSIQETGLNYRIYVPADYDAAADKLPLMIYLNGAGSRGTDNVTQLKNLAPLLTPLIDNAQYRSIIIVPQLPTSDKWVNVDWSKGCYAESVEESNSAKLLMGLIAELKQAYSIDANRVYLMGQSFGGYGTWDLITRHPETFAAAVPMCGAGCTARAAAIKDMPLLVLHGNADLSVPVAGSRDMVAAVKAAGNSTVTYLEYEGDDHYIQRRIFEQPELYLDWMFSQSKDQSATANDVSDCRMPALTLNMNSSAQLQQLTVTGGTASISGEQLVLTPTSNKTTILALVNDTQNFTDGMLTVHVNGGAPNAVGLVLRAQDAKNYIHVRYNQIDSTIDVLEFVGGSVSKSANQTYTNTDTRISCLRVDVSGTQLTVYANNIKIMDYTIQTAALQTAGSIGLRSYGTTATVDDLIWAGEMQVEAGITITSLADRQVIQRNVTSQNAQVKIAGTAADVTGLKARVTDWAGETTVVDWTDLSVTNNQYNISVTVPQGGWYKAEVTGTDINGESVTVTSGRFGVGINILCIGQSNMVGIGQGTATEANDLASNFMNETWSHLEDPYDKGDTTSISSDSAYGTSMVPALANALIAEYGIPVGIIPAAKGGAGLVCDCTSYPRWLDRTESDPDDRSNLYGNSLYRAQAAGGIEFILMNQGEHDVSGNTSEADYLAALQTLVSNYRKDLGYDVPFLYCQLGAAKASGWTEAAKDSVMDGIRTAQLKFNEPANGIIMAAVESDLSRNSDNLHYTTDSQNTIGERVANTIIWYYDTDANKTDYYTGPSVTDVEFADDSRKVIDVHISHGGGTDFTPTTKITGFVVRDGSTEVEISSAVRKDADTITLTLATATSGETSVRYLDGLLPDVSGIVKDNSAMQLPLNTTEGWLTIAGSGGETSELIFEAENLSWSSTGSWDETSKNKGAGASGHGKFDFAQTKTNAAQTVSYTLPVTAAGTYTLYLGTKDNPSRAKFKVSVNGTQIGEVDQYSSNANGEYVEHMLGTAELVAGNNTVTFTLNGKNSSNTTTYYGGTFDYFRLVEVGEVETPVPEDVSFDLLALYRANAYTASGVVPSEITDNSIKLQRVKLDGKAANNEIAFDLGNVTAGTYEVVLNSKYYESYGTWSFKMAGNAIGGTINFNDDAKNGTYHDVPLGTITHAGGKLDFTFVSANGGTLVPVSVSLNVVQSGGETADKTELQNAVTGAAEYQKADYTEASWDVFSAALTAAQAVLDDADATAKEIADALSTLNSAIEALQKAPTGDGTGTVLYENKFETLPEELKDVSGWQLVKLMDGTYALQGTSAANTGLLAQFTGITLPEKYTVVVDMALMENQGTSGYSAGLTFQHTGSSAFYHYRLDKGTSHTAQLYRWNSSASKLKQGDTLTINNGEAYRLRITVDGTTMTGYVDGTQMLTYSGAATGGNVGLRAYSTVALFDNLVVYEGVVAPGVDDKAPEMVISAGDPVIWNNEDEGVYSENVGTWADVAAAGQNGSAARTAESGSVTFSNYSPATGNFLVQWYVPADDGAEASVTIQTLNGTWKTTIPADTKAGWYNLGIVSGTESTAFTINVQSVGKIYADAVQLIPTTQPADEQYSPTGGGSTAIAVLVNQIGYDTGTSMRATVPNALDGTKFQVVKASTGEVAYEGTVIGNVADFTEWKESSGEYYITCAGAQSYNFSIGTNLIYYRSVENALKFMAETRADTFEWGKAGVGWRDSHQFSFELNGLVLQYMANPSLYDNMDYQIYKVDTCEYEELRVQDEPALIWLIQFAAARYYDLGAVEGKKLHMLIKEQLAYYLYLYPEISEYVDQETYEKIRDYTISVWGENACTEQWYGVSGTNHNLYTLQTAFGGLKGSQPPGHSIVPNLLMYEVAKRDGLGDDVAKKFFDAAYDNCAYLISDDFDLNDPFYNKGQRMSEYITIPALAWFLEEYPSQAPSGLRAAISSWATRTIARSDNMWDIRMAVSMAAGDGAYSFHNPSLSGTKLTQDYWTGAAYANADNQAGYLAGGAPKNEPGNQAGLQAVTYAAARVLGGDSSSRLRALGVAAIDDLFGRNPSGRAAFYHFTRDFVGGDLGWYMQYKGGNGMLGGHTAVIDANAPEGCYPYNPDAYNSGYTEGWVAYNTAWNASLAYSAADAVALSVQKAEGGAKIGTDLAITLTAPVNLNSSEVETAEVVITSPTGEQTKVKLTETANSSQNFCGTYTLPDVPYVTVSYGSGLFKHSVKIAVEDFVGTPVTSIELNETELALDMGATFALEATVMPEDATDKAVTFESSNEAVAKVSSSGVVTAVGVGEAVITVTSDFTPAISTTCSVVVAAAAPAELTLDAPASLNVFGGSGTVTVTAVVYSDGTTVTENLPEDITYSSSNRRILTVDADGKLTPVAAGTASITAKATVDGKEITGTAEITVTADASYDLLGLYKANKYTASGATVSIAANTNDSLTESYGLERVKLAGGAAGNEVSFLLDGLTAGEYNVTLYTKYMGGTWAYGVWTLKMDDQVLLEAHDFDNADKNGYYHNLDLGKVTLDGAAQHKFTFVSVDGGNIVPVSVKLDKITPDATAKIGDVEYTTLNEAIAAAETGATIELIADAKEELVILNKDIKLDLNGHSLEAETFVTLYGTQVENTKTTGYLKVPQDGISLQATNTYVPVWNESDGYYLVEWGYAVGTKISDDKAATTYYFLPKPRNDGVVNDTVVGLLQNGAIDNQLKITVQLAWSTGEGLMKQTFVFNEDMIAEVYTNNSAVDNNGKLFILTVTGYDNFDHVTMQAITASDLRIKDAAKVVEVK